SGILSGNTVTNPKEDLKGITTRSGVAYQGPTIPTPSNVAKQGTELSEMARIPMNKHCLAVILNMLPKKLGDPEKFLIPCEFPGMDECLALADLGVSINLMPLSVWKGLLLPELTLTCMTLELADQTESKPVGIAKYVKVKVGMFHFPADFVVVDFEPDPRVPLILGRCFLKTSRALIDVHKGELTLRIRNEAITYNLDQTSKYSANYDQMTANKIDVADEACKAYSQEVLGFSDATANSLNSAAGGNFLDKMPSDCLKIIENKSKVRQSRANTVVAKVNSSSSTPAISSDVAELKDMVRALLLDKKNQSSAPATSPTPAPVKAVESNCVTCGGTHSYQNCPASSGNVYQDNIHGTAHGQPPVTQSETLVSEPIAALVSAPMPNLKPSIPYPSRRDNERRQKLNEMARTPMNEHCSAVILNKLPKKLGDPGKFLIPCEFPGMDECLALADLGASINLMPLSVWKELALPELTPTCMTLELADRSVSKPIGIAKDVSVKVGMFHFRADFVVVDFKPDPRVPLILERCFLKTGRALIDVHKGELTLRIGNEAITYNLDQTSRYSVNYDQMTENKIDVTDEASEEYFQEVLGFSDVTASGSLTPSDDPIVSTTSPTLTSFGDSDFLLFEEDNAFLGLEDDPDSPKLDPSYYDPEGDIQMLEAILNSDHAPSLPNHEQSVPSFTNELKACEAKTIKSSVDEPPEVELKDLPPYIEYAFIEGDNKLPVIIAKELGDEEKAALIKVLKSHKQTIAWKLSDIQGINPEFCTHKILMEGDYKPEVQHQRRVNPKIHDVLKKMLKNFLTLD
nr:reverse transcriptase domain-containing protein [Tanacetum cinerariifolium]